MKYYLNSDGSRFPKINRSGFGGFIRDSFDNVLVEYTQEITENDQKHNYELWGLITGLELAIQMDIKNLVCRCDDKTLMKHLNCARENIQHLERVFGNKKPLVEKVLQLTEKFDSIDFHYIVREENKYSDLLSRKYTILIEKNFLEDHKKLKEKSIQYFVEKKTPPHSVLFYDEQLTMVPFEFNPFTLSQNKNKLQKEFRKSIVDKFNDNWELVTQFRETISGSEVESINLKKYNYTDNNWDIVESYFVDDLSLNTTVDVFIAALQKIQKLDKNPWIYTDIEGLTDIFYLKKPLSREIFPKFLQISQLFSSFDNIIYHRTPKIIERKFKDKHKRELNTIEETVQLIKSTNDLSKKNKFFGQLMSTMIKDLGLRNSALEEKLKIKDQIIEKYNLKDYKRKF